MLKLLILLALATVIFIQSMPAFCGVSRTMSFQISVTIPPHIISNSSGMAPFSNNPYQLVQTQIIMRGNKTISMTSIVVP